ncbi:MAG: hypothetical protein KGI67_03115, partial [Pseudomonadota bacterium]|nr:hypothetical protein [Pseudomonadota bacterium]
LLAALLLLLAVAPAAVLARTADDRPDSATAAALPDTMPAAQPTHRPEWMHVPASDPNMEFYLDRASIEVHHGEVDFWDVVIFRQPTQRDETSERWIKEKRTLRRVRCANGQQALIKGSSFDEQGHLIEAVQLPPSGARFVQVHPGSVAASELYRVCREAGIDVPAVLPGEEPPFSLPSGQADAPQR